MPAILVAQISRLALTLRWFFMERPPMWRNPMDAAQSDLNRLYRDTNRSIRYGRLRRKALPDDTGALLEYLTVIDRDLLTCEQYTLTAEAVQRFQWEVVKARAQGTISRSIALLLIDESQLLCEDLWACERAVTAERPTTSE